MSQTHSYFNTLNYSLANEDTGVEYSLAPENGAATLCIAGSGSRVLPLIARTPSVLEVADLAEAQLKMTELRLEAARQLEYEEFLYFLGYLGALPDGLLAGNNRLKLFAKLKLNPECRNFWHERREIWTPRGFIYLGKWENHFIRLGKLLKKGLRLDATPLFAAQSIEEQRKLVQKHWHPRMFRTFLQIALSDFVFRRFLYGEHYAGSEKVRTAKDPAWQMVDSSFKRFMHDTLLRKNYFLQMMFLGELRYSEGFPTEARPDIYRAVRASSTEVRYTQGNFVDIMAERAFDFYSLLDTISYLPIGAAEALLNRIPVNASGPATMVIRSFMRQPKITIPQGWEVDEELVRQAGERDCTGVYDFLILRRS